MKIQAKKTFLKELFLLPLVPLTVEGSKIGTLGSDLCHVTRRLTDDKCPT
jgi:hypothetical protein